MQNNSNLSSLLSGPLDFDPVYFVQNYRTIDGEPFIIEGNGRDYLKGMYRYLCIEALRTKKPGIICKGRQVEATEAALNVALYYLCNYKFFNVLHSFPTKDQVSRFSKERLQGALRFGKKNAQGDSKLENMKADHKNAADTVSTVEFLNHNFYYMYSAWGEADSLRGLSVDLLLRDEFQDWSESAIANTAASTSRSKYAVELSFGTPKEANSPFENLWNFSDQRYYHSRCTRCQKLFMISMDNLIHGTIVKCVHCGVEQEKRDCNINGEWIPTRATNAEGRAGFHISQLIHPEITKEAILRFKQENSESKFKNEVLGEFYTGGTLPLNERDMVDRCCMPYKDLSCPYMITAPNETFMGVDWGGRNESNDSGAFTVVTIIGKNREKFEIKHTEMLTSSEHVKQVAKIKELIMLYNCVSVVVDSGYGHVQCQMLQSEYGPRVKSAYYAPNAKNAMSYNEESWMLTIERNTYIEQVIDIINRGQLIIPWKKPLEWFVQQVCNIEIRVSQKSGNVFKSYEKVNPTKPNDAMHSLNYAYIASIVHLGQGSLGRTPATAKYQQTIAGSMVGAKFSGRPAARDRSSLPLYTREGFNR